MSNMNLVLPTVSQTPGPQWASIINSDLTLIDQHNHTPGFGAPIPVAALNINDSIAFGNNAATGVGYLQFNPQAAATATSSLYVDGNGDFFYNNSLGGQVQITSGGGLAALPGSITNLPSGTAAVTFSPGAGSYTFTKATNQGAVLDSGPIVIRTGSAGSNAVGITPHPSTSNYVLVLPSSLPASVGLFATGALGLTSFLTLDTTLSVTGSTLGVAPLGITSAQLATDSVQTAKIQNGAVTYAKMQAANYVIPGGNGVGTITSTTYVGLTIPGPAITVVAGRPLIVQCVATDPAGLGNEAYFYTSSGGNAYLRFVDGASLLGTFGASSLGKAGAGDVTMPPSVMSAFLIPAVSGPASIYLQGKVDSGVTLGFVNVRIIAYQI